ncbi:MAG: hypothetical protein JO356_09345 [Acidobacteria bacterium]|nr:hypothetical protein [Acidobacteriota bacterium]
MVGDLRKLTQALSEQTPEKLAEREIQEKSVEIEEALKRNGVYTDPKLGVRIVADR